jgi:hypothetical protein
MTSLSEISVVRVPSPVEEGVVAAPAPEPNAGTWASFEAPSPTGRSPVTLAVLALVAGVGAMALGALAVVSAARSGDEGGPAAPAPVQTPATPDAERQALALLANPSTERIVFRGSGGRLLLVVGSAGRAAILVRGTGPGSPDSPAYAWVIRNGKPVRAARLTGSQPAVFLTVRVGRGSSVAVGSDRAAAMRPGPARVVATRN